MDKLKRGRPSLRINLTITSEDDERFSTPKTFESVLDVYRETGFSSVGIISAYNSKRITMRKGSNGFICHFRWGELNMANSLPKFRKRQRIVISVEEL